MFEIMLLQLWFIFTITRYSFLTCRDLSHKATSDIEPEKKTSISLHSSTDDESISNNKLDHSLPNSHTETVSIQHTQDSETVSVQHTQDSELGLSQDKASDKKTWSPDRENINKYLGQIRKSIESSLVIN